MNGKRPRFWRDELLMLVGAGLFGLGALLVLGFSVHEGPHGDGTVGAMIFTAMLLMGGVVVFRVGLKFRRLEQRLGRLLELLRTVDHTSIRTIAQSTAMSEEEARQGVLFLISHGYISLRLDPELGQVHSPRSAGGAGWLKLPGNCPNCSAPCPTMVQREVEPPRCEYCDAILPVQAVPQEKAAALVEPAAAPQRHLPRPNQSAFSGNWGVLIFLFIFFWPAGVIYLMKGLKKHGGSAVYR